MSDAWVLGQRALREGWRTPEALLPTLFIPLFFLVVNVGQAAKIFPSASTEFLHGQGYGAFQLPSSRTTSAGGPGSTTTRPSTTCSSTPRAARASTSRATCRR